MNQDLHLHESILLLSLDDEKGNFSTDESYLNYGFVAALIMDLVLAERIVIEDEYIKLTTNAVTDNKLLNHLIRRFQRAKKEKKVSSWLHALAQENGKFIPQAIDNLVKNSILERKKGKVLWVFSVTRYPTKNVQPENLLRARLGQIIFGDTAPTPKERMLLALIQACRMEKDLIPDKDERKRAKEKIKALTKDSEMRKLVGDAITEMQALVTVITSTVI